MRWLASHVLWDPAGSARGFPGALWAARKLLIALLGSMLLTWLEWVKHHPPEIAIVAVMHFAIVLAAVAVVVWIAERLR